MLNTPKLIWKAVISIAALLLAFLRIKNPHISDQWLDSTFLLLIVVPPIVFLIPWERLRFFEVAGVKLALESPSVRGAIAGLKMPISGSRSIQRALYKLRFSINDSFGSRVLWIDDNPKEILGERRLLRALSIEVLSVNSSSSAEKILNEDNDFDLIISDMQRKSEADSKFTRYGGIELIKKIREENEDRVVRNLPTIFYTAYRPDQVEVILDQVSARDLQDIHFCHSIEGLIIKVFSILPVARSEAIKVPSKKPPTDI